ncbi:GNAT family N-acetyltransferase (plasmid) [Rossellomorea sp. AcN35-11]|nr:GNAT family N-acetyltransferase [Rossellomorea aquimaris]WJV31961.1 GNAT family N-acetyltransferase [Rossellomorea sp. AcN35-11]
MLLKEIMSLDHGNIVKISTWEHSYGEGNVDVRADIKSLNLSTEEEVKIGTIKLYIFDEYWDSLIVAADGCSSDTSDLVFELLDGVENDDIEDFYRVGIIDRIFIDEEYRNKGIGSFVFKQVNFYLSEVMNSQIITLMAKPIFLDDHDELLSFKDEKKQQQLVTWYKSFGYKQLTSEVNHLYIDARYNNLLSF